MGEWIAVPTVLRIRGYRFFFFSLEGNEPPHIHVEQAEKTAKFWLKPINLASSYGFRSHELSEIRAIVVEHSLKFLEKWYEHFGN